MTWALLRNCATRVLVMYGGKVVEKELVNEIFYDTAHPYTKGLMQSIAKLDTARGEKLHPIEGTPPDLFTAKGMSIAARCSMRWKSAEKYLRKLMTCPKEHMTCCWLQHEFAPDNNAASDTAKKESGIDECQ